MSQPTVYTADQPDGRPATDAEIAEATAAANDACRAFINSGNATHAERNALTDTYRAALNRLRELNGGHLPRIDALHDD